MIGAALLFDRLYVPVALLEGRCERAERSRRAGPALCTPEFSDARPRLVGDRGQGPNVNTWRGGKERRAVRASAPFPGERWTLSGPCACSESRALTAAQTNCVAPIS